MRVNKYHIGDFYYNNKHFQYKRLAYSSFSVIIIVDAKRDLPHKNARRRKSI